MTITRREFVVGAAACACGAAAGCISMNNAPLFEAGADNSLLLPKELAEAGSQVKVRLPSADKLVLVWRTKIGFGGISINCTHKGSEVHLNAAAETLDCPSHGSRFKLDGTVAHGPAEKPLRTYVVDLQGDRLKILG
jgi:nitrite reductase/ring-hydroxylating ferredoxin subunit